MSSRGVMVRFHSVVSRQRHAGVLGRGVIWYAGARLCRDDVPKALGCLSLGLETRRQLGFRAEVAIDVWTRMVERLIARAGHFRTRSERRSSAGWISGHVDEAQEHAEVGADGKLVGWQQGVGGADADAPRTICAASTESEAFCVETSAGLGVYVGGLLAASSRVVADGHSGGEVLVTCSVSGAFGKTCRSGANAATGHEARTKKTGEARSTRTWTWTWAWAWGF
jgi:hypothetical protein